MVPSLPLRLAFVAVAALLSSAPARSEVFRAYLASYGADSNPCTLPAPCRLLPAALAATADRGEIWMLDSANFNTGQVNITKSVTILAIPGALGSVVATGGGDAININAAGVIVTLRNLVIVHLASSANGINFVQGAELNVAECEIANVENNGIRAIAPGSKVTVKNTVVRGVTSGSGFGAGGTVVATLDGVHLKGNGHGVSAGGDGVRVTVSNSVLSGNQNGALASNVNGNGVTRLVIERSVLSGNWRGVYALSAYGPTVEVTLSNSAVTHNSVAGIQVSQNLSSTVVVVDGNRVTENEIGFFFDGGPATIHSRGNNTVKFNGADLLSGTLTAMAGM